MKTLLSLAIWILIFCEPLLANGSPLQSDIKGQSSDHSDPTAATLKEIESLLGTMNIRLKFLVFLCSSYD